MEEHPRRELKNVLADLEVLLEGAPMRWSAPVAKVGSHVPTAFASYSITSAAAVDAGVPWRSHY
jgi:hypothetical protein